MNSTQLIHGYPKVWADLAFQNRYLRLISLIALSLATISASLSASLAHRKPAVIALDRCAQPLPTVESPSPAVEAEAAARRYIAARYGWDSNTLGAGLKDAKPLIAARSTKAFDKTVRDLIDFGKGKTIAQRVYPTRIAVDVAHQVVKATGDRITEIQGMRVASVLQVALSYETGPRTFENPWGIYIVKEEEQGAGQ